MKKQKINITIEIESEINCCGKNKIKDFVKPVILGENPSVFELTIDGKILEAKYSVYVNNVNIK